MKMSKNNLVSSTGLILIGVFSILYSVLFSAFAKVHLTLPYLNLPLFVGEMLLGVCLMLFLFRVAGEPIKLSLWHYCLAGFYIFIAIKIIYGYYEWGALALRHAMLFIYPLFAVITYYFYNINFFINKGIRVAIVTLLIATAFLRFAHEYYYLNYLIFIVIFLLGMKNKLIRNILIILLIICAPYKNFITSTRAIIVSLFLSLSFLLFIIMIFFARKKLRYKVVIFALAVIAIPICIWQFEEGRKTKSLFDIREYFWSYQKLSKVVNDTEDFEFKDDYVRLYQKDAKYLSQGMRKIYPQWESTPRLEKEESQCNPLLSRIKPANSKNSDVLWRIFLWKDAVGEVIKNKILFGVDFGKPFRSRSVEILKMERGRSVGWLSPHNSYVHIFYRAGIIGIFFIIFILALFVKTVKNLVHIRDIKGVLLSSALLYWLILANFVVLLELPYFAIPFWSLYGLWVAYADKKIKYIHN